MPFEVLILAPVVPFVVLLGIRKPKYVFYGLVVLAPFSNFLSFGPVKFVYFFGALGILATVFNPRVRRRLAILRPYLPYFLLLMACICYGFVVGGLERPVVFVGNLGSVLVLAAFLAIFDKVEDIVRWLFLFAFAIALGDLVVLIGAQFFPGIHGIVFRRVSGGIRFVGFYENPNAFGYAQVLAFPILAYFGIFGKGRRRTLALLAIVPVVFALLGSQSRSAIGGAFFSGFLATVILVVKSGSKYRFVTLVVMALGLVGFVYLFFNLPSELFGFSLSRLSARGGRNLYAIGGADVVESRFFLFEAGLETVVERPMGLGYRFDRAAVMATVSGVLHISHNSFIANLVVYGVFFGVVFNLLWLFVPVYMGGVLRKANYQTSIIIGFLIAAQVGYLFHGTFHAASDWIYMWLLWGASVHFVRLTKTRTRSQNGLDHVTSGVLRE